MNSADHTTLVAAVKAAGLVETLQSAGSFTCRSVHKDTLVKVLTHHVVVGKMNSGAIKMGGGKAQLKTVAGGTLTVTMSDGKLMLTDEKGGTSTVTIANVMQSNGVPETAGIFLLFVDPSTIVV